MSNIDSQRLPLELVVCGTLLVFGFLYAVLMPPLVNPDEGPHFMRVHAIASGQVFPPVKDGVAFQTVPASLSSFQQRMMTIIGKPDAKYPYHQWFADSHAQLPASEEHVNVQTSAVRMSPVQYIPHVIGYWCGRILFAASPTLYNWQARVIMARLGGVVFAAAVYYVVIRRLSVLRYASAATILLPMQVLLAAAVTSDTVLLAACVAYAAAIAQVHTVGRREDSETYAILGSAFLIGSIKWVYLPLLTAVVLLKPRLPARDFRIVAGQVAFMAIAGLAISATLFFPIEAMKSVASEQMRYLLDRPGEMIRLPLRSLIVNRDFYLISMMMNFGSLDTSVPIVVIVMLAWCYVAMMVADCCFGSAPVPAFKTVVATLLGIVATLYGVFLAIYCQWTSLTHGVGTDLVHGVQGRYLIPLLPFVALLVSYIRLGSRSIPTAVRTGGLLSAAVIHVVCVLAIVGRYWIP
jgi:uncharacterized membrane protein